MFCCASQQVDTSKVFCQNGSLNNGVDHMPVLTCLRREMEKLFLLFC